MKLTDEEFLYIIKNIINNFLIDEPDRTREEYLEALCSGVVETEISNRIDNNTKQFEYLNYYLEQFKKEKNNE